jgi:hypothetical protein
MFRSWTILVVLPNRAGFPSIGDGLRLRGHCFLSKTSFATFIAVIALGQPA